MDFEVLVEIADGDTLRLLSQGGPHSAFGGKIAKDQIQSLPISHTPKTKMYPLVHSRFYGLIIDKSKCWTNSLVFL